MRKNPVQALFNVLAGSLLTVLTALVGKTWAAMYLPLHSSWLIAGAVAFVPGYLLNKALTRSYRRIEPDATEMGSLFGTLALVNVAALAIVFFGLAGLPASIAGEETMTRSYATLGLLDTPLEATLAPFPRSTSGTGVVWVPNIGSVERPRIITRHRDGRLRATWLPPRGKILEAHTDAVVGPADGPTNKVMLCPVPTEDSPATVQIRAHWSGGNALFLFGRDQVRAYFNQKGH